MTNIELSFVKHYEAEVHLNYQQMGSKLRSTVRVQNNIVGSTAVFQQAGKGQAQTKNRTEMIPTMNIAHGVAECQLQDFYAGEWIDKLDQVKQNYDEIQVIAKTGAYALGRKTDELIIEALSKSTNSVSGVLNLDTILSALESLGNADVPDDGQRYAIVGWKQWANLLKLDEFAKSEYVGANDLPFNSNTQAKKWLGTIWMPHGSLPLNTTTGIRKCFWYHKTAIGHAIGYDIKADITWHGDRASHFVNNMMSQGSCLIDDSGVVVFECPEVL